MHPFDAASFFSATPAEGSFESRKPELVGAASSPSRGTRARAGGENAGIRCHQDCRHRAKAFCAHCCRSDRGFVCPPPGHVKTTSHVVPASSQCSSERQPTLAAASPAAVDVEPIPKRPRRHALSSVAAAAPTTTSSVDDQPIATAAALERFAREVSMDAVFRRVRLGGGGGPAEPPEVAYYTTVTIAGHVFRGVLYDVGPHSGSSSAATDDASDMDDGGSGEVGSSLSTAGGSCCLDLALGL